MRPFGMMTMKTLLRSLVVVAWAIVGLFFFGTTYALVASQFHGRTFWDLERSLGGFTIHLTRNISMDILWFQAIPFIIFLVLWSLLLVWILNKMEKTLPNNISECIFR